MHGGAATQLRAGLGAPQFQVVSYKHLRHWQPATSAFKTFKTWQPAWCTKTRHGSMDYNEQ
jgi:hypothetical protein